MIQDQAAGDSVAQALRPSGSPTSGLLIAHVDGAARWAPRLASFALGTGCLVALVHAALLVPLHVPLNYNEGWNAYHALEAARGAPLYPAAPQFFFNSTNGTPSGGTAAGTTLGSTSFGQITSATGGRVLQLGAKLTF